MKINQNEISSFLNNIPTAINSVLIYGSDSGLVNERVKKIESTLKKKHTNINTKKLQYNDLLKGESTLMDHVSNLSLFAEYELYILSQLPTKFPQDIELVIEKLTSQQLLIIKAAELATSSPLRKFFESNKNSVAIACYNDDSNNIAKIIRVMTKENDIVMADDLVEYLSNQLKGNRQNILSEINKLILYVGKNATVNFEDIKDLFSFSGALTYEDYNFALANKNMTLALQNFRILVNQGVQIISIIRSSINYFTRLYQVKSLSADGKDIKLAMKTLTPPVFILHSNIFTKHLNSFSMEDLSKIIYKLYKIELFCKTNNINQQHIMENFIINYYSL
jgi:DNA polymerase III subunit delta